jgi:hypothetical protein
MSQGSARLPRREKVPASNSSIGTSPIDTTPHWKQFCCAKHPGIRFEKVRKGIPDSNGEIAGLFGAQPGTFYLLRPDLHIAGR